MSNPTFFTHEALLYYDAKIKEWMSANFNKFVLPTASASVLGGLKVGTGLLIDANGVVTVDGKVIAVEWNKINGIPSFSEVATSGSFNDLSDKPTIPTSLGQLINDLGYQTLQQVYELISSASHFKKEVVDNLPEPGIAKEDTIYLLKKPTEDNANAHEEWLIVDGAWELIGSTKVDLTNYWNKDNLIAITNAQIDALFA